MAIAMVASSCLTRVHRPKQEHRRPSEQSAAQVHQIMSARADTRRARTTPKIWCDTPSFVPQLRDTRYAHVDSTYRTPFVLHPSVW